MSRLARLAPDRLDVAQRQLYDAITGGPRASGPQHFALTSPDGSLNGPFDAFLRSPTLGAALQEVGAALRFRSVLSDRVRESAILLVSTHWDSEFERYAHEAVGAACGLSATDLAELRRGELPRSADAVERSRLEVVQALLRGDLTDGEWERLVPAVGEQEVFELTTLVGYYATLAMQLRVFRVGAPTGA